MSMIEYDRASISAHEIGKHYNTVRGGDNRLSVSRTDINSAMESAFSIKWINTLAEGASNLTFHRPQVRSGIGPNPVRSSYVAHESKRNSGGRSTAQRGRLKRIKLAKRIGDLRVPLIGAFIHEHWVRFQSI